MNSPDAKLLASLEYRLKAIAIGHFALRHHLSWSEVPSLQVLFDGNQVIEGKATGFTNAAIEAGTIHCRAVLEFLGLNSAKSSSTQISNRAKRLPDDYCVEQFPQLEVFTREKALAAYPGPAVEAEAALSLIFHVANKGLAHTTNSFDPYSGDSRLLEVAFRGIPVLLINGFYAPLGIQPPAYELSLRPRPT